MKTIASLYDGLIRNSMTCNLMTLKWIIRDVHTGNYGNIAHIKPTRNVFSKTKPSSL